MKNSGFLYPKRNQKTQTFGFQLYTLSFFPMKKGPKKSWLNFFWLKMGFAARSQPEPLPTAIGIFFDPVRLRSLVALLHARKSHFINAKTN
jgi:hypothetical protein